MARRQKTVKAPAGAVAPRGMAKVLCSGKSSAKGVGTKVRTKTRRRVKVIA